MSSSWSIASGTETVLGPKTATVTSASPAVFTITNHGLNPQDAITLTTTGTLPYGLGLFNKYFVLSGTLSANSFTVSGTLNGTAINTTNLGAGTITATCEQMLVVSGTNATFQFAADMINAALAVGSITVAVLRIYDAVDGVTPREAWRGTYQAFQYANASPAKESPFQPLPTVGWFTVSCLQGPNFSMPWRVIQQ